MNERSDIDDLDKVQIFVLRFVRALEHAQQHIQFNAVASSQCALREAAGEALTLAATILDQVTIRENGHDLHRAITQAVSYLKNAQETFLGEKIWPDFGAAFIASRYQQCQALEILYRWRADLPLVEPYFRLADDALGDRHAENLVALDGPAIGISHHEETAVHNNFSLYVPEYYDPTRQWPLIVSLHGGYGRGDEYIWTWLRPVRSRGYVLLSPKSIGPTWSIMQPALDVRSIVAMMDKVCDAYAIDRSRVYLTGLSDGGTFSYLLGFEHHERFAGVAPIAAVLSPSTDVMLRAHHGKDLPLHVIHGAHDMIFPVQTVRSTNELLISLGYDLTYTELPDWGHAMTYAINEELVLPWFARLDP